MNQMTTRLLEEIAGLYGKPTGAYNIRENGKCAARNSSSNIEIIQKPDGSGIDIRVKPCTAGERVYIPACVTHGSLLDIVSNDFYIGEGADVTIVAGCGIHNEEEGDAQHNGIHRFFIERGARVVYLEKHIGEGNGGGKRIIHPSTECQLDENSTLEMDTTQLRGVDSTARYTSAVLNDGARLIVREKLMTDGAQQAETDFEVLLSGDGCGADVVSRSVARGTSRQTFRSRLTGSRRCTGHTACDAIIMGQGVVRAIPELTANHVDAALIHEAAIGKIAGEQLVKLMSMGLTALEAEEKIIEGFLR